MLGHVLDNNPRVGYAHQTNLIGPATQGTADYGYTILDLISNMLSQYNAWYNTNSPVAQMTDVTEAQTLAEQGAWATAESGGNYTASVTNGTVTVTNNGSAVNVPITVPAGTTVNGAAFGTAYGGQLSAWVNLATGATETLTETVVPSPWTDSDVGSPALAGSASYSYANGVFTVNGGGADIWGTSDQFNYVSQSLAGDGSIVARVTSQSDTDPWAKAGVMIKQSTTSGTPYALLGVTPGNGIHFEYGYNTDVGGESYTFPNAWLKLTRTGSTITAFSSADGGTWTPVGATTISMTAPVTIGLFTTSHNASALGTATFDNVSVTAGSSPLPSPWADADVGSPAVAGAAAYASGVFTVNGGGADIWGTSDQFNYVSQSLAGDGSIVARVTSQSDTNPWAKAGVMIKQSTTSGTPYALLAVTPGNGVHFEYGYNTDVGGESYSFPNGWLKLTRTGSTITAFSSADGSTWTPVGATTISMTAPVTIGLFTTSHNASALGTATFDNVSVTAGSSPVPSPWADADVGSPSLAGAASYANGVFTVNGGGADIWGTSDQFNYVSQPLTGNASIVARVTSQSDTDPWAKAGVMIKQSTTSGSSYALLAVTPGNGVHFEHGYNTDVGGESYSFPNGWLKLTRTGSTITAFSSADGSTWTQVGATTISLTDPVTIGLFTTSHNAGALGTATFDNVSVTAAGSSPVPSPWADADVGSPAVAGSASYASGVFTVNGGGADIWGSTDQFNYVSQPLTGNASIVARVTSQSDTDPWAKAGVMIKQSTAGGTNYALLATTPGNGITFQSDFNAGESGGSYSFPVWLKLTRSGSTITASTSTDGTTWTTVGSTTISLTDPVTIGLFNCAHSGSALNTATFDNVSVT